MCGFFAGVFERRDAPDAARVAAALAVIGHRGPDGSGSARIDLPDGRVAVLGHVRLALVGLVDGAQPFVSPRAAAVVNGEFYGWRERRRALERMGATFRTRSDSEIALASYEVRGAGGWIEGLDGEWAAAVIDLAAGTLHAACDPMGAKPLRHWSRGRSVAVASEAKALIALGVPAALDGEALRFSMALQYLPSGRTLFAGIGMLPPGCRLDHDGTAARVAPYASPFAPVPAGGPAPSPGEAIAALRAAVRRRIPDEVSFCTHLSGGLDSALVLALAAEVAGPGIDALTAAFPFGPDEVEGASVTARHAGARLVPVEMGIRDLLDAMDRAPFHAEAPCINVHAGAKIILAEAARALGHKVALTGEGADEAFWGYEHLRLDTGLPMPEAAAASTLGVHRPECDAPGLDGLAEALGGPVPGFVRTKAAAALSMAPALGPRLAGIPFDAALLAAYLPASWLSDARSRPGAETARALWCVHGLSGYILRGLDDAMGMARGVESRIAFLDPGVRAVAARAAPAGHFGAGGMEKRLLRDGARGLVPDAVLARRKLPFMGPSPTATPEGAAWVRERILGGRLASSGLFDRAGLEGLVAGPDRPVRDAHLVTLASLAGFLQAFELA